MIVGSEGPLSPSDEALRARLVSLGLIVDVKLAIAVAGSDALGKVLVVVSESITSSDLGDKLTAAAAPVLTLEPAVFDDLKMTGATWLTDLGDAAAQQELDVALPGHFAAAGLTGRVRVASAAKFVWGRPGAGAQVVATLAGNAQQAGGVVYDAGSQMVGLQAPGRRVGFFAGRDTPLVFTNAGWALFDAAVRWSVVPHALLAVGGWPMSASDAALRTRLAGQGYAVEVVQGPATKTTDLVGKRVGVVSESVTSTDVNTKYSAAAVPVVTLEPAILDDLGMTAAVWQTDQGDAASEQELEILQPDHALGGGFSGTVTTTSAAAKYVWGKPNANATVAASLPDRSGMGAIFGCEHGAAMVGRVAPARRVGFFAGRDVPALLTTEGWKLFDAAVRWAAQPMALLVVGEVPLRPADAALAARLRVVGFQVHPVRAMDARSSDADGRRLVVVSESSYSRDVNTKFANAALGVLSLEPAIFPDMRMTGSTWMGEIGECPSARPHPMPGAPSA